MISGLTRGFSRLPSSTAFPICIGGLVDLTNRANLYKNKFKKICANCLGVIPRKLGYFKPILIGRNGEGSEDKQINRVRVIGSHLCRMWLTKKSLNITLQVQ